MTCAVKRTISSQKGFSLSELLVTTAILLLTSIILAAGVPTALRTYMGVVDESNAQLLLATTTVRLRDELCSADVSTFKKLPEGEIGFSFTSFETGLKTIIKSGDDGITIKTEIDSNPKPLVPKAGGNKGVKVDLIATFDNITCDETKGIFTFTNLKVVKIDSARTKTKTEAKYDTFKIGTLVAP